MFSDNSADGLPLGVENQRHGLIVALSRRLKDNLIARLRYGFYELDDDSTGGINDYRAHLASASLAMRF